MGIAHVLMCMTGRDDRLFVEIKGQKVILGNIKAGVDFGKFGGGVCLVGKILLEVVGVFLSYLEAPSYHI